MGLKGSGAPGNFFLAWARACDGGIAVTVAVMIPVLVGILALSIDLARLYNASTERNNAADAAAIAAATQLDQQPGACLRALQAAFNTPLLNEETFVSNKTGRNVYISDVTSPVTGNPNIQFLSELVHDADGNVIGTYIADPNVCDETAEYVEVVTNLTGPGEEARVDLVFAGLTGALSQAFPKGYAVAQGQDLFCAELPLFMCPLEDDVDTFWSKVVTYEHQGKGVWLKAENNNDQYLDGNFGFLRLQNVGAAQLGEQLGKVNPPLNCLSTDTITTEPGANESAARAFNSRIDIFHQNMGAEQGDPDWQPAANAVKGYLRSSSLRCDFSNSGYQPPPTPYTGYPSYGGDDDGIPDGGTGAYEAAISLPANPAMPLPRDIRTYGGDCEVSGAAGRMCDGMWQSDVYWAANHPDLAFVSGDPLLGERFDVMDLMGGAASPVNAALPGTDFVDVDWDGPGGFIHPDGQISRYEMYLWELDRPMTLIDHPRTGDPLFSIPAGTKLYVPDGVEYNYLGPDHRLVDNTTPADGFPGDFPQAGEFAGPQCGTIGTPTTGALKDDRRVIEALLVDCDNLPKQNGNLPVPKSLIKGSIDLFVVEEWKFSAGGDHDLYVEIIGPGEDSGLDMELNKQWVVLKESRNSTK